MLAYVKTKFTVSMSKSYFIVLRKAICDLIDKVTTGRVTTTVQKNLLDLIHVFIANVECMVACRIQFPDLLPKDELRLLKQMQDKLDEIQLFEGQENKKDEDMSPEELFQLHLYTEAGNLNKLIELHLDIETRSSKLEAIENALGSDAAASGVLRRYLSSMSTKTGMKNLFDGTREELEHSRRVLNKCLDFATERTKDRIRDGFGGQPMQLAAPAGFLKEVSVFIRTYCQELFVNFGFDMLTILENKDVPREGDLSKEDKVKLEQLQAAERRKKMLEEVIYESFILISQALQGVMQLVADQVRALKLAPEGEARDAQKEIFEGLRALFQHEDSLGRLCMTYGLMMSCYKVDVLWLDEAAEALRNCASALDSYLLMKQNLPGAERRALDKIDTFGTLAGEVQRQFCYSIGVVANRLIQYSASEADDKKNIAKLNILQGGVEPRFIPSLTQETKDQIEGSFKLTNEARMQKLAQQDASEVVKEAQDVLLGGVIDLAESKAEVEVTIRLLQQALRTKVPMCPIATIGGENGMNLTRAAFAVLLKCTDNISGFIRLVEDVNFNLKEHSEADEAAKLKAVVQQFRLVSHPEFEKYLKQWE